jgi:hypothetical protein
MTNKDSFLLERAYLSISQKTPSVPSDDEVITTEPNEVVSAGPMDEPAPGSDMDMVGSDVEPSMSEPSVMSPVEDIMSDGDDRLDVEDEDEEDSMSIDNLNSIRESIVKIASFCAGGNHLEPWQQQKLAIAMDNLADVARRVK